MTDVSPSLSHRPAAGAGEAPPVPGRRKTLDTSLTFPGLWPPRQSACRLRLYETPSCGPSPRQTVIVVSQIGGSSGTSITNAIEEIAARAEELVRRERPDAASDSLIFVEHYPPGTLYLEDQDHFSLVTFARLPDGRPIRPTWRRIGRAHVEQALLGQPLDP